MTEDEVERVAIVVAAAGGAVDPTVLRDETGLSQTKVMTALSRLEEAGVVEIEATGEVVAVDGDADLAEVAEEAAEAQEQHREFERSRTEMIRGYAELRDCRRGYLLNYFGEEFDAPCGRCDNCEAGIAAEDTSTEPFAVGARVAHAKWGEGAVQRYEADKMVVLFDDVGYKTLAVGLVVERGLLAPAGDPAGAPSTE